MEKKVSTVKIPALRLSPATPLQAIGNKARRASAIAAAEKIQRAQLSNKSPKKGKCREPLPKIELSVRSLSRIIESMFEKTMVIVKEKPDRYSASYAIVKLFNKDALIKHKTDMEVWVANGCQPAEKPKPITPDHIYVFYPSVYEPDHLGSVALYCRDSKRVYENVHRTGLFLGAEVRDVSLESGVTRYVDVLFKK